MWSSKPNKLCEWCKEVEQRMGTEGKQCTEIRGIIFHVDSKYEAMEAIGEGSYGVVCSAVNRETNEKVGIKKLLNAFENKTDELTGLRQLRLVRQLGHPNVISILDIINASVHAQTSDDVYIVYELMDTSLDHLIKSSKSLTDGECRSFLFQLLQGLKHLHMANVLHRNLKPSNLLLNANSHLKISDIGLHARKINEQRPTTVHSRLYRAPELLLLFHDDYTTSTDIWSVGCIFAEMLGRKPIFAGYNGENDSDLNQLRYIISMIGSPNEEDMDFIKSDYCRSYIKTFPVTPPTCLQQLYPHANPAAIDLLEKMLVFNPCKRITVPEALEHPYFASCGPKNISQTNGLEARRLKVKIADDKLIETARDLIWKEMLYYHPEAAI
eukprot:Gb_14631 [translate_table: standard]